MHHLESLGFGSRSGKIFSIEFANSFAKIIISGWLGPPTSSARTDAFF